MIIFLLLYDHDHILSEICMYEHTPLFSLPVLFSDLYNKHFYTPR